MFSVKHSVVKRTHSVKEEKGIFIVIQNVHTVFVLLKGMIRLPLYLEGITQQARGIWVSDFDRYR